MHVSASTIPNLPSGGSPASQNKMQTPPRFSLKLDAMTHNSIVAKLVLTHQVNLSEDELDEFISKMREVALDKREKHAIHSKYVEGLSIAKNELNVFGETAHEFGQSYSQSYFQSPSGKYILDELILKD